MLTSLIPFRLAGRHLAGGALISLVAGCAGDDLLLPRDGELAELKMVSGDRQTAPAGAPVEHPLVVEALDGAGRPVPGAAIVFEFVDSPSGAELAPENTETDEIGRASAEVTLGTPAGDQRVEARPNDPASDLRVQFLLTALLRNGGGGDEGGDGQDGGGDDDEGASGDDGGNGGGAGPDDDDGDEGHDSDDGKGKGKGKGKGEGH